MKIPFKYTFRNFRARKLTAVITVTGISLVVFVFAATLMMAYGVEKTLVSTGSPENIKVLRESSQGEISSIIDGDIQNIIKSLPHIAKGDDGNLLISAEPVVIINLEIKGGGMSNVAVRGVSQPVYQLRPQVKLIEGRLFNPNLRELIVGKAINKKFDGAQIGSKVKFAGDNWEIVGMFEADGSGFESEIWGDGQQMLNAFNRGSSVSTLTLKLDDMANYEEFNRAFETDKRLQPFETKIEPIYYEEQAGYLADFIRYLGIFITVVFSFGATIGATITMYSAVANRTIEIGTMRSLGFSRRSILTAFLFEAILISLIGGILGIFFASFLQLFSLSTLNWSSFSELSFSFSLSPDIIISSIIFAIIMGVLGGFFPSVRAARLNIVKALRAG